MSSARLPRGAERGYNGGIRTGIPGLILIPLGAYPLLALILWLGHDQLTSVAYLALAGGVLLHLLAISLLLPTIRLGRNGALTAEACRRQLPVWVRSLLSAQCSPHSCMPSLAGRLLRCSPA
jgi:hypothetical protein